MQVAHGFVCRCAQTHQSRNSVRERLLCARPGPALALAERSSFLPTCHARCLASLTFMKRRGCDRERLVPVCVVAYGMSLPVLIAHALAVGRALHITVGLFCYVHRLIVDDTLPMWRPAGRVVVPGHLGSSAGFCAGDRPLCFWVHNPWPHTQHRELRKSPRSRPRSRPGAPLES